MKKFAVIYTELGHIITEYVEAESSADALHCAKSKHPNKEVAIVCVYEYPTFEQAEAIVKERMREEWKKCASHPQCDYASVMFYTGDGEKFSWNLGVKIIGPEIKGYGETFEQAWAAMPTSESIKAARIATLERELAELKGK